MGYQKIDLMNLQEGALNEKFQYELQKVIDNINDPNTDPKAVRMIQLNIRFFPDEKRKNISTKTQIKTTYAALKDEEGRVVLSKDNKGKFQMYEESNLDLPSEEESPNEIKMEKAQ